MTPIIANVATIKLIIKSLPISTPNKDATAKGPGVCGIIVCVCVNPSKNNRNSIFTS
ncbi:hypothetical protein AAFN75_13900 [Algibacter sp. AS12]